MRAQPFKYFIFLLITITANDCNNNRENEKNNNKANHIISIDTSGISVSNTALPKKLNYNNWETFWKVFTTATKNKDTAIITELTNFPFIQNTILGDQHEFSESWISQVYRLRNADSAILWGELHLQIDQTQNATLPKFDSVRYTNKNQIDFYFAKVDSFYRLIEIITPG